MPQNLEDLKKISEHISNLSVEFEKNKKELKKEISIISPILKSLKKSLNTNEIDNVNKLTRSIKNVDKWVLLEKKKSWIHKFLPSRIVLTEEVVIEIDIKLIRLITDIENIKEDNEKNLLQ